MDATSKAPCISKAVEEAYKGFMMQHQYPFCVLYFTMDTELLDVNVHPTKMELRFSNNEEVYRKLYQTIRDVLTHKEFIPAVPVEEKKEEKRPAITGSLPEPFETKRLQAGNRRMGRTGRRNLSEHRKIWTCSGSFWCGNAEQLSYGFRICGFCFDRRWQPDAGDATGSGKHTGGG